MSQWMSRESSRSGKGSALSRMPIVVASLASTDMLVTPLEERRCWERRHNYIVRWWRMTLNWTLTNGLSRSISSRYGNGPNMTNPSLSRMSPIPEAPLSPQRLRCPAYVPVRATPSAPSIVAVAHKLHHQLKYSRVV